MELCVDRKNDECIQISHANVLIRDVDEHSWFHRLKHAVHLTHFLPFESFEN